MLEYIFKAQEFVRWLHPLVVFVIFFLGMYVFWRGCTESRKNRSSVFDMFLISGFLSAIIGRVVYIFLQWDFFSSFIWYWLPYEKYGEKVYLLDCYLGGFLVYGMVGLILAMFVFTSLYDLLYLSN